MDGRRQAVMPGQAGVELKSGIDGVDAAAREEAAGGGIAVEELAAVEVGALDTVEVDEVGDGLAEGVALVGVVPREGAVCEVGNIGGGGCRPHRNCGS